MFDDKKNLSIATVAVAPSPANSGNTLGVQSGEGAILPATPFNAVAYPPNVLPTRANAEIVRVTAKSTDTLTISRQQEGSSQQSIGVGWTLAAGITVKAFTDIQNAVAALDTLYNDLLAIAVTESDSQVLSNKELIAPVIASFVNATHNHTTNNKGGQLTAESVPDDTWPMNKSAKITKRQNLLILGRSSNVPTTNTSMPDGSNSTLAYYTVVPTDYVEGDITIKLLMRPAANGNIRVSRYLFRFRPETAFFTSPTYNASLATYNLATYAGKSKLFDVVIPAAEFQAGDGLRFDFLRLGAAVEDTVADVVEVDDAWIEYTGRA